MAKKIKTQEKSEDHMTKAVRSSAQQIWQAGLGAFTDLQQRTRSMEGDKAGHVRETVNTLEQVFEERVTRALESIGVPMRKEIDALTARVDDLTRQVEKLSAAKKAEKAAAKPAAKKAVKKPAAKKAAP
ncbi:phasin family protein [Pseudoduganella sp. UC29_106]|uniref:phasin family protein n=1 Tax=Pseudoduganella sp. UC29_106 TaxID=3374553 RepID=UPI0037574998